MLEPAVSQKVILNLRASCEEQLGTGRISVMLKKALADHTEAGNLISAGRVSSTPLNPVTLTEYFSQTFKSFLPSRDGLFKLNLGGARSTPLVFSSQAFSMALLLGIFEFSGSRRPPAHTSNTMVGAECLCNHCRYLTAETQPASFPIAAANRVMQALCRSFTNCGIKSATT